MSTPSIRLSHRPRTLALTEPFRIARGVEDAYQTVEVSLHWETFVGYGEATPVEHYGETVESASAFLDGCAGALGSDPFALEAIEAALADAPGEMAAKAAVDAALHDLCGQIAGLPLWRLLGVSRVSPPTTITVGLGDPEAMARRATKVADGRYRLLKLKLGGRDGLDIDRVGAVRAVTELPVMVDVNEYWSLDEALESIPRLRELGVEYVEQPLRAGDPDGPSLKEQARLPIFVDEDCHTLADVAVCTERAHGINIKLAKCGGVREAIRMVHAARALDLGVMIGCMGESSLGLAPACPVASLCDHVDLDGNDLLVEDPWQGIDLIDGVQVPSERPGLGVWPVGEPAATPVDVDGRPVSPRIAALTQAAAAARSDAVAAFWRQVEAEGTPIVEPGEDLDHVLVTFVWRDLDGDLSTVAAVGGPATWSDIHRDAMRPVEGTDVWSVTYRVRSDLRGRYFLAPNDPLTPSDDEQEWETREAGFRPDPWNPRRLTWPADPLDPTSRAHEMSIVELPDAPPQPWVALRDGVVAGSVEVTTFRSRILGNERRVWVHTPAGPLRRGLGLLVVFDGWVWAEALPLAPTLDNLMAFGQIPPLITVMVDPLNDDTRVRELQCDPAFLRAICDEVVPWIRERRRVSRDPARTVVAGQSLGGLTSAYAALERPDVFGNAIVQSGSFWWPRGSEFDVDSRRLTRWYVERPASPARIFMEVGVLEGPDMVPTARHLRDVMQAKGYDLTYREYHGGHDWYCWRGGLADGLVALLGSS